DCDLAIAGVETDGDAARISARGFLDQRRIAHRRGTDDDAGHALAEPAIDGGAVANAAAELQRNFNGAENALDCRSIHRLAGKGAVKIDQMQIFKALPLERLRLRRRVAVEHGRARHVALLQAHGKTVFEIDGGKQDHGTRSGAKGYGDGNIITDSIAES